MTKVITYGTYDHLHYGHIRLLQRAKALGDYLIVGVTADDYDKTRGKINVQQSLMERIEAIRETGIADEIIVEEYEGQKIDDIFRYDVDIFTVGSDWIGKFDYLNEYCKVVYLERTWGVSSSDIRKNTSNINIGFIGDNSVLIKHYKELQMVNGGTATAYYTNNIDISNFFEQEKLRKCHSYTDLLECVDAVYIASRPESHYEQIKEALNCGKHVLCESPIVLRKYQVNELFKIAKQKNLVLMEAIKTAYSTAYSRMLLLAKSGKIGKILSVDAVCTSLRDNLNEVDLEDSYKWNSICAWGPTAMLPVFQLLGTNYLKRTMTSKYLDNNRKFDAFTKIDFVYSNAVASVRIAKSAKSEGELIITGEKGYIYVPAPWWKTDFFELRYENMEKNRRYFYQLDGEGIRYELVAFVRAITSNRSKYHYLSQSVTEEIASVIEYFFTNGSDYILCDS